MLDERLARIRLAGRIKNHRMKYILLLRSHYRRTFETLDAEVSEEEHHKWM
jgi:hypothetical protein